MKTLLRLIGALVLVSVASAASAQTSITTTTNSVAITNTGVGQFTITVASTAGMAANGILYIDGSVYRVVSVNSATSVTVISQYFPATHLVTSTVYLVPVGAQMGKNPVGSCIRGTGGQFPLYSPYTLMFNLSTGDVGRCWGAVGSRRWIISNPYAVGAPSNDPPQTP